jgi:hypothetical protein
MLTIGVAVVLVAIVGGILSSAPPAPPGPSAIAPVAAAGTPTGAPATVQPLPSATESLPPTLAPSPTAEPTPVLVPAPLTGRLVTPEAAAQHPIAVMIDDQSLARPQSGFNSASVVWQAPAEGGIPRYMLVFQETVPGSVGPVRSARSYFIAWAADWTALYVHAGGSPDALATLASKGAGQYVYNADQFRNGRFFWRVTTRSAPHNLYTDGPSLRRLASTVGATDGPMTPAWTFGPDAPMESRPSGGRIDVAYLANKIRFDYQPGSNAYVRSVSGASPQTDAADRQAVAPKNVVIMVVRFSPLNDGSTKNRLDAQVIGSGVAWIATNGRTIKGTWRKTSMTSPTTFQDGAGNPVTLTIGQTFIEVVPSSTAVKIADAPAPTVLPATIEPTAAPG